MSARVKCLLAAALAALALGPAPAAAQVSVTVSAGAEVTEAADCSSYTGEGDLCWDTDDDVLYIGDGATATAVGPGSGSGDMTKAVYDVADDGASDTANALAANGANCDAGQAPLGVDASGAVEGCWSPATGSVATDAIFEAAGDMAVGTGANTSARVAIGADNTIWKSTGTTGEWSNTLDIASLDMSGGTNTIPWLVGTNPTVNATGEAGLDSDGANVTGDMTLRVYDGTNVVSMGRKLFDINVTVVKPQDVADAVRDAFLFYSNETGMTYTVTSIKCWAGADDTTLNVEETDADGANNATVDALECATGTGPFTVIETTITGATIEAGHLLWLDFDDTDDPSYVKLTISGWFNAAVD